jgi:hypothetical protein
MKVCLPEEVIFLEGEALEKYDFWGYKASYLPTAMAIHCLLYLNYTQQQQSIFLNQFNILFNLCSCLCWWLHCSYPKNEDWNQTFHDMRNFLLCQFVCCFQVRIRFFDDVAMGARRSGIHDVHFPGARGLGIHEVLSSWHVTYFN